MNGPFSPRPAGGAGGKQMRPSGQQRADDLYGRQRALYDQQLDQYKSYFDQLMALYGQQRKPQSRVLFFRGY